MDERVGEAATPSEVIRSLYGKDGPEERRRFEQAREAAKELVRQVPDPGEGGRG